MTTFLKRAALAAMLGASVLGLSACGATFATDYATAGPAEARTDWRVSRVDVTVPETLVASEANTFVPSADIVWHGDPAGDRKAQVATIVKDGISAGVGELRGPKPVLVTATLVRFHALTPKAYFAAPAGTGVHSVAFDLVVSDAASGAVLAGPVRIEADLPGVVAADSGTSGEGLPGAQWKSSIQAHIAATMRSWLGTGPDIRASFARLGG